MTTKISGDNLQADISIDTTGNQIFNGTLKLDANFPTGTDNVALGNTALDNGSLTGSQNVAIGTGTLTDTDSGADNTAVGFEALKVVTTGTNNTAIGSGAGSTITSGSNLTLVGYNATPSAVDATNEITLGDANVTDVRIPGAGFYIDSTGLGIGTSTPAVALDVVGAISATGNLTSLGIDDNATSTAITINSSEQVGIGTSSPDGKLHIDGASDTVTGLVFEAGVSGDNKFIDFQNIAGSKRIGFEYNNTNIKFNIVDRDGNKMFTIDENQGGDISFYEDTGTTPKFFWDASEERLGIGTTSPSQFLEVAGSGSDSRISIATLGEVRNNMTGLLEFDGSDARGAFIGINAAKLRLYTDTTYPITFETNTSEAMRIDSSGNVGIGTSNPFGPLQLNGGRSGPSTSGNMADAGFIVSNGLGGRAVQIGTDGTDSFNYIQSAYVNSSNTANDLAFFTGATEAMRIDTSGNVLVSKTTANSTTTEGASFDHVGSDFALRIVNTNASSVEAVMLLNRQNSDGGLVTFRQANTTEGTISVSGATVSYNGFTGTHWSRLSDNSKPTILKGTILESLDEMMDWYQVQFDITETDDEGNETTRTEKQSYELGDDESVGDVITYNHEGTDYSATIIQEADIKHVKCKVSDTANSKRVYGVFVSWDYGDDTVNDMYVAQVGTYVIRVHSSATVEAGDMLVSNGDGTAVTLSEDTPWTVGVAKTIIGKVLSTTKIETYEDGSYTVPCSLSC